MILPEPTSQDSAERVELQMVSVPGAPSTVTPRAPAKSRCCCFKLPVRWLVFGLVFVTLLVVVVVGSQLSTGRATSRTISTSTGKTTMGTDKPSALTFFPRSKPGQDLIWFSADGPRDEIPGWINLYAQLRQLVAGYHYGPFGDKKNMTVCSTRQNKYGKACFFDVNTIAPQCTAAQNFGYKRQSPCVFIQFANVTGWNPEPILPREVSRTLPAALRPMVAPGLLLLHCDGDTPADREYIGPVAYSPYQGFRTEFFPYSGHPEYMPPMVAVQFLRPERGVVIGVRCRLWVRNPPPGNASAEISFFLLVD
ncbi:sodium/potassium-transporting ATPase subunit beta-2-like isoform X1 [Haemaphysalis longicornis]